MNWLLFLKVIDGEYYIVQAGCNMVPTDELDKVLPVEEHVARQADKLVYNGEKLKVKEGETLLTVEELNKKVDSPLEKDLIDVPKTVDVEV